ncbi:hypothetical protein BDN72DRAFT_958424 [Pluteus cervinus]|uniref:Uncharacterized protein n=1 Tax=Pluteus cervinus TaxID=181527 RepID=A0ACD3AYM7_9AGAR|nr:hypothetical protein BDN72DRAFT_958424 [Pluteus cervinus]
MARALLWVMFGPALIQQTHSYPVNSSFQPSIAVKSERSWLWGWAWGAESTVSIVDRSPVLSFPSRPAAFGAEINEPILGYVIPLSSFTVPCEAKSNVTSYPAPNTGCPDLCLSGDSAPTETWIALVQRGQCEFVKKVREAQRLGARGVVVGGQDPEESGSPDMLVNMYSPEDSSDVTVPATYIRYSDYAQLWDLIETSNTTHSGLRTLSILITAEYSAWEWYSPIITFIIILLLPSALTFITLIIHRIRASRAAQRDRAPEDVVRKLPWRIWTGTGWEKHDGSEDPDAFDLTSSTDAPDSETPPKSQDQEVTPPSSSEADAEGDCSSSPRPSPPLSTEQQPWFETQLECAICLCDFVKGDKVRVLPCHHIFHLAEVDEWLIHRKKLCPVCKADVTQERHDPETTTHLDFTETLDATVQHQQQQPTPPGNADERTPLLTNAPSE